MSTNSSNIQVCVRVRPFNRRELQSLPKCIVSLNDNAIILTNPDTLDLPEVKQLKQVFTFDKCFWSVTNINDNNDSVSAQLESVSQLKTIANQFDIYREVGDPILQNVINGFNGCIMAYGQSGSGKTYTMIGSEMDESWGLIPRICESLFKHIDKHQSKNCRFQVEMSFMEIYAEQIRDLLQENSPKPVRIREHPTTGPFVENLTCIEVRNYDMIQKLMDFGSKQRITAATNLNDCSSRAHSMFTLHLRQFHEENNNPHLSSTYVLQNKLCLVDLAGSERVRESGVKGKHLQEASDINTSLTALGRVISILAKNTKEFVPFRDSSLTWMLKDILRGNSKTVMMATISPSHLHFEETLSTLQYAYRTKQIVNRVSVNSIRDKATISKLRDEFRILSDKWSMCCRGTMIKDVTEIVNSDMLINDKKKWSHIVEESKHLQTKSIEKYQQHLDVVQTSLQFPFLLMLSEPKSEQEIVYYLKIGTTPASIIDETYTFLFFHDNEFGVWLVPMDKKQVILLNDIDIDEVPQLLSHGDKITIDNKTILKFKIPICAIK